MSNLTNLRLCVSTGLVLIPIPFGKKGPEQKGWNELNKCFTRPEDFDGVDVDQWNWGLHHVASGTCAIDIDNVEMARWEFLRHGLEIEDFLGQYAGIASGNHNHAKILFRMPPWIGVMPSKQISHEGADGKKHATVDFRCAARDLIGTKQDVLPGSWHPDTLQPYQWENDGGLGPLGLQEIPQPLLDMWVSALGENREEAIQAVPEPLEDITVDQVRDALTYVDADLDRPEWVEIAMSIHNALGPGGFPVFDEWSSTGSKYGGPHDTGIVWRSIHEQPGGVTFRTLWGKASKAGWLGHMPAIIKAAQEPDPGQQLIARFRTLGPVSDSSPDHLKEVQKLLWEASQLPNPAHRLPLFDMVKHEMGWSNRRLEEHLRFLRQQGREIAKEIPGALSFPHTTASGTPRDHSANLRAVCDHKKISIRHNRMSHDIEIHDPECPNWLEDEVASLQRAHIKDLCVANSMPHARAHEHINTLGCGNSYHPMEEYLSQVEWDGQDWFSMVRDSVKVEDSWLWDLTLKRWALSVCAAVREKTANRPPRGVLVMAGPQLIGKTTWFKYLTPRDEWFKGGVHLDPNNKDVVKIATKYAIVEIGEMDATFKKTDLSRLKAYLSNDYDEIRLPYAAAESRWRRRTVYCGTVNNPQFLVDRTGNTRFWVNKVKKVDLDLMENLRNSGGMAQFWAQVNHWLNQGETWDMDAGEMKAIERNNDLYMDTNTYEELLLEHYAWPDRQNGTWTDTNQVMSTTEWCPINPMSLGEIAASLGGDLARNGRGGTQELKAALLRFTGQTKGKMGRARRYDYANRKRFSVEVTGRWYYMPMRTHVQSVTRVAPANFVVIEGGRSAA